MVFPAPLTEKIFKKVSNIVSRYDSLDIELFSPKKLNEIKEELKSLGFEKWFISEFVMEGYGNVRNMGIVGGALYGADNLILLDDDEIVVDKDYIQKATEYAGKRLNGRYIGGVGGYYVDKNGNFLLDESEPWWRILWKKANSMNRAFSIIKGKERLVDTTFVFGGNMVINKILYSKVPFDPYNTRGEDIDFLLNAKYFGFDFPLDRELKIVHLPPERKASPIFKIRQDIIRSVSYTHLTLPTN